MAFLDFREGAAHAPSAHAQPARQTGAAELAAYFDTTELRVVQLARGDTLDSLRPPARRGWLARFVLGPTPPSRQLANTRLEALRRLVVQAWHKGFLLPVSVLQDARKAGFSEDQVSVLVDSIGRARSAAQMSPL